MSHNVDPQAVYQNHELWMFVGSQTLYGPEVLKQVEQNASKVAAALSDAPAIPLAVRWKGVLTSPEGISAALAEASTENRCAGVIVWMHTFSPAKMWIAGLNRFAKPLLHFHTQFNRDIPWDSIDMDFMNLNQTAHGGREFGFIATRLGVRRKVVVGHWQDQRALDQIGAWSRAAAAWADQQGARIVRFGDNMRYVAVTEGNKVEAELALGYMVNGYGVGDLVERVDAVPDAEINRLAGDYEQAYQVVPELKRGGARHEALRYSARLELGMRAFLEEAGAVGFSDSFECLTGLDQLPGMAVQRLMADGYGFGGEGDWKTAALVRAMKVMAAGLPGGTSFMEDYTYHFEPGRERVLGAHMLEICPTIASGTPRIEIHPLGIGGKSDPVRMVFDTPAGPAVNASIVDLGNRMRLIVNEVDTVPPDADLPKLPVARTVWIPRPNLADAAAAWIYAGGAHHTGFSHAITTEVLEDYAEIAGMELVVIDARTETRSFRESLRWNELYWRLQKGLG